MSREDLRKQEQIWPDTIRAVAPSDNPASRLHAYPDGAGRDWREDIHAGETHHTFRPEEAG